MTRQQLKETMFLAVQDHYRLIAFGENHCFPVLIRRLLIDVLPDLKATGFNAIALEFFEHNRADIRRLVDNEITEEQWIEKIRGQKDFDYEEFATIVLAANALEMELLLVNSAPPEEEWRFHEAQDKRHRFLRSQHMAGAIKGFLDRSKSNKVVFHAGRGHTWIRKNEFDSACEILGSTLNRNECFTVATLGCAKFPVSMRKSERLLNLHYPEEMMLISEEDVKKEGCSEDFGGQLKWWDKVLFQPEPL